MPYHTQTDFWGEKSENTEWSPICCIHTFPACCGQAFLPGGASRTVHSSLLLSGECWWASICEWQPGGGEPPNTPLLPHCSQGKGLIQDFLISVFVFFFCKLIVSHFIPLCMEIKGQNFQTNLLWCWHMLALRKGIVLLSKLNDLSLQPRRRAKHSDTPLSGACSQIWGIKPPCYPPSWGTFPHSTQIEVLQNQM